MVHRVDEFWSALSNLPKAAAMLEEIENSDAPATLVAFLRVVYDYERKGVRYASDALHRLVHDVIDQPVTDASLWAQAYVWATSWATLSNNVETVVNLNASASVLWATHGDDFDVMRWRPACDGNVGACLLRNGRYDEAIAFLDDVVARYDGPPEYFCVLTRAHTQLAICHARLGNLELARRHAEISEVTARTNNDGDIAMRLHAWGEVYIAAGNMPVARETLRAAAHHASQAKNSFLLADIKLALCIVYRTIYITTGNDFTVDLFWTSYDIAYSVAFNDGVPHVLDALAKVCEGVPIIDGREVLNRCVRRLL